MNYVVDIVVVALLAAFAGRGVTRGLILSAGKLVTLAGGLVGAHLGAFYLKAPVAERIILPWLSTSTGGAAENGPVEQIMGELAAAGVEGERVLMDLLESMGFPRFSISRGWGTLIRPSDRDRHEYYGDGPESGGAENRLCAAVYYFVFRDSACDDDFVHVHGWA